MVDHESAVPVYVQVAGILRAGIADGTYPPGRRLPSVTTLMQEHGIASVTARKALRVLVAEGLAESSPGIGTFVRREDGEG